MRVIKYPEPEQETITTCSRCGAELAYTGSDCHWKMGAWGDIRFIICPCCSTEITISYTPYPVKIGKNFYEFSDGSWAEEANP